MLQSWAREMGEVRWMGEVGVSELGWLESVLKRWTREGEGEGESGWELGELMEGKGSRPGSITQWTPR